MAVTTRKLTIKDIREVFAKIPNGSCRLLNLSKEYSADWSMHSELQKKASDQGFKGKNLHEFTFLKEATWIVSTTGYRLVAIRFTHDQKCYIGDQIELCKE